uniref:Uncharacterized protein n=1 Tax=Strigamia maritima TaxID=126957 RepID=T1JHX3_STRMM
MAIDDSNSKLNIFYIRSKCGCFLFPFLVRCNINHDIYKEIPLKIDYRSSWPTRMQFLRSRQKQISVQILRSNVRNMLCRASK